MLERMSRGLSRSKWTKLDQNEQQIDLGTGKEVIMETLFILLMLVIILDIASLRWGCDSTERIDSPEWERRAAWHVWEGRDTSRQDKS